jgi:hypothetical protein
MEETGWKPIETAPKDGSRFLAAHRDGEIAIIEVTGQSTDWSDPALSKRWDARAVALNCASTRALCEFTHWMPLPAPPHPIKDTTK